MTNNTSGQDSDNRNRESSLCTLAFDLGDLNEWAEELSSNHSVTLVETSECTGRSKKGHIPPYQVVQDIILKLSLSQVRSWVGVPPFRNRNTPLGEKVLYLIISLVTYYSAIYWGHLGTGLC